MDINLHLYIVENLYTTFDHFKYTFTFVFCDYAFAVRKLGLHFGRMATLDVIVVGAGIEGSSTAYWCAKHGLDTLLLEQVSNITVIIGREKCKEKGDGERKREKGEERERGKGVRRHLHIILGHFVTIGTCGITTKTMITKNVYKLANGLLSL